MPDTRTRARAALAQALRDGKRYDDHPERIRMEYDEGALLDAVVLQIEAAALEEREAAEELREALRPFVDLVESFREWEQELARLPLPPLADHEMLSLRGGLIALDVGHLRSLVAALQEPPR